MRLAFALEFAIKVLNYFLRALLRLKQARRRSPQNLVTSGKDDAGSRKQTDFCVVVTTHSRRFSDCLQLIDSLSRELSNDVSIYVVINADTFGDYDQLLRSSFLSQATKLPRVFPVCLGNPAGMSELWNLGIRLADSENVFMLQDDLLVDEKTIRGIFKDALAVLKESQMVVINDSYGHFGITKDCVQKVGWFDERFLGFGEEDGDYSMRYRSVYGSKVPVLNAYGLHNEASSVGYEEVVKANGKYSLFNTALMRLKYTETRDEKGHYSWGKAVFGTPDFHPGVRFRTQFESLLNERNPDEISGALRTYLFAGNEEDSEDRDCQGPSTAFAE